VGALEHEERYILMFDDKQQLNTFVPSAGISKDEAIKQYIAKVEELVSLYGIN